MNLDQTSRGYRDVTVHDVKRALGATRVVDVRELDEWLGDLGHIAGAEHVPLAQVAGVAGSWDPKAPIILVCRSGNRSGRVAAALAERGFADVMNMAGGMLEWNAVGLPVARG